MRKLVLLAFAAVLASCAARADAAQVHPVVATAQAAPSPRWTLDRIGRSTRRRIDAVFADFARTDTPGFAFGIAVRGRLIHAQGYGQANLDDGVPITRETRFHLASLSKQFTAAAIALLILDGTVSLDDPVGSYLPDAVKYGTDLTLRHLVYMTSGIRDYTERSRRSGQPWFTQFYFTRDEAVDAALLPPALDYPPGEKWSYSNVNYMLLTQIVEAAAAQPFADFAQRRLFGPLGMNASHVDDDTTRIVPHRAMGYARRDAKLIDAATTIGITLHPGDGYARMPRVSPHFGGSGVFSTLDDLARWSDSFDARVLGGPAFATLMRRRETFPHGKDDDAFGLVHATYRGHTVWWYSGGDMDGSTYMAYFPDARVTLICLSNLLGSDCEGRARRVLDLLLP